MTKANENPELADFMASEWRREKPDLPVEDAALLGVLIGVVRRIERTGQTALKKYQLLNNEHDLLACLRRKGQPYAAIANDILSEILLTSGALTTCVDRLIKRGLLIRAQDKHDRRKRWIKLTDKGVELIDKVTTERFQLAATILQNFNENDKAKLKQYILQFDAALLPIEKPE
ncbi:MULTISPECIES: MarR family winged helix-turn-helix transcriptional regulator [Gammaproteobacteria]|uniref:MarR family winged helix-turn-helix transcriptional regulator n=1 Tax=Gammaproteobacteria TaxID=1236 RepID=UPI000DD0532F|nr:MULTISPECIES: MarR family transcriptional regulator [Gammaproteobacteria]RTE86622.1 MarR family transcriptional regulator [Aliidiomarina sp. B3213]TCZ90823.1 MarR family transcriptional regulator [Lysobacter sp. N42]